MTTSPTATQQNNCDSGIVELRIVVIALIYDGGVM